MYLCLVFYWYKIYYGFVSNSNLYIDHTDLKVVKFNMNYQYLEFILSNKIVKGIFEINKDILIFKTQFELLSKIKNPMPTNKFAEQYYDNLKWHPQ